MTLRFIFNREVILDYFRFRSDLFHNSKKQGITIHQIQIFKQMSRQFTSFKFK